MGHSQILTSQRFAVIQYVIRIKIQCTCCTIFFNKKRINKINNFFFSIFYFINIVRDVKGLLQCTHNAVLSCECIPSSYFSREDTYCTCKANMIVSSCVEKNQWKLSSSQIISLIMCLLIDHSQCAVFTMWTGGCCTQR